MTTTLDALDRAGVRHVGSVSSSSACTGGAVPAAPTADQRSLARRLLGSPDVDLILGHHAHVVQPVERVNGKFVVYGMGNFLAKHAPCCDTPATRDGVIVRVVVAKVPTPAGDRAALQASWRRTVSVVESVGGARAGVVPG
ncbi:MAG: CapA family protein [Mycobacteriales bacterium]